MQVNSGMFLTGIIKMKLHSKGNIAIEICLNI